MKVQYSTNNFERCPMRCKARQDEPMDHHFGFDMPILLIILQFLLDLLAALAKRRKEMAWILIEMIRK
jgi:hypothetical protein